MFLLLKNEPLAVMFVLFVRESFNGGVITMWFLAWYSREPPAVGVRIVGSG